MKTKIFNLYSCLAVLLVAMLSAGCTDDLELPVPDPNLQELEKYYFILGDPVATRSVDYRTDEHSEFTGGELLGCFALDADGNAVNGAKSNACYAVSVITSEDEEKNGRKILVPNTPSDKLDKGYAKYLFYYPYNKDITSLEELKDLTYSVESDQNKHEDYEASDLLWDVAKPEGGICRVEMDHVMANIIIVIDGVEYDVERGAVVLQQPLTAENIDLTAPTIDDMRDVEGAYYYSVDDAQEKHDIQAMYALYSSANDRFRTAVPANRTLKAGDDIIKLWSRETGNEKTFRLKNDVRLEAGKNYYFTLIKKGKPQPGLDDDSWVLDVLDPETGEPVGLLCREYLHWQREYSFDYRDKPTRPADENGKPVLNSQAWVFYNLQDDGKTPDLSVGKVLRFVYDVRVNMTHPEGDDYPGLNGNGVTWWGYAWPAPHIRWQDGDGGKGTGLYLAKHGYGWSRQGDYGVPDNEKAFIGDYYMNGGTVLWNGAENEISAFIMPDKDDSAVNADAERYGHIAIPRNSEGGKPFVSYKPYDNDEYAGKYKVGFVMPHYLIDTRTGNDGKVEQRRYPLVKIGFNQFWMSKSLRAKTYTDGTSLHKFNTGRFSFQIHENTPPVAPDGYIYPFYDDSKNGIDPLYDLGEDYVDNRTDIPLLYNYTCFMNDKLLPRSVESISFYKRPSVDDYTKFCHYLGRWGVTKMATDSCTRVNGAELVSPDIPGDFIKGCLINVPPVHCGNISGLNLRPWGYRASNSQKLHEAGGSTAFFVETDDATKGMYAPIYFYYAAWNANPVSGKTFWNETLYSYPVPPRSQWGTNWDAELQQNVPYDANYGKWASTFHQVRFLLKYKGQNESVPTHSMMVSRSASCTEDRRDVYVAVE